MHYADAFEEAGITIEDVYNIANITNQEDCSPLFRLNLLVGRRGHERHARFSIVCAAVRSPARCVGGDAAPGEKPK